ncbi:MAG TPA: hypothetical protein PK413_11305 [Thermoanaerobaculia bacterium]|nr:hypothetical protein [Thermoanaerobaculia bacterium]
MDEQASAPTKGRPSIYTPELAAYICGEIAAGRSLRSICREDDTPSLKTIFLWLGDARYESFLQQYEAAMAARSDTLVEDMLEICDDSSKDYRLVVEEGSAPKLVFDGEHVQRSRLKVDTRKWIASKFKPKKYGESMRTELTGKDGGPLQIDATEHRKLASEVAALMAPPAPKLNGANGHAATDA